MPKIQKILIVDDEPTILEMYGAKFKQAGIITFTASSAIKALEIIKKEKPNLIFLDIIMPKKDGFWLFKKIRSNKDKDIANISVIMLTNLGGPESRTKCSQLGCVYYLIKAHHTPADLLKMAKEVLKVKK